LRPPPRIFLITIVNKSSQRGIREKGFRAFARMSGHDGILR
jgi:hypothetical protein